MEFVPDLPFEFGAQALRPGNVNRLLHGKEAFVAADALFQGGPASHIIRARQGRRVHGQKNFTGIRAGKTPAFEGAMLVDRARCRRRPEVHAFPTVILAPDLDQFPFQGMRPSEAGIKGGFAFAQADYIPHGDQIQKPSIVCMQGRPAAATAGAATSACVQGHFKPPGYSSGSNAGLVACRLSATQKYGSAVS
jgi:hypothetical protein